MRPRGDQTLPQVIWTRWLGRPGVGRGPGALAWPEAAPCTKTPCGLGAAWTPAMPGDWLAEGRQGPSQRRCYLGVMGAESVFIQYISYIFQSW